MNKIILSLLITTIITSNCFTQKSDIGNCFIYYGNKQIDKKWNWWHEAQYRNYNFAGDMEQMILRTGVG